MDFHPIRQYIGASVTRAYYAGMGGIEDPKLRDVAIVTLERQELFEPQILPLISAGIWRLAGQELLWAQRLLSILLWLSGGIALYRMTRPWVGERVALVSMGVFTFIPFSILCSRVIQPDPAMVVTMLWAMERLQAWRDGAGKRAFWWFLVLSVVSVLLKPMSIFMIWAVYVGPGFCSNKLKGVFFDRKMWLLTACMVIPNALWYLKGHFEGDTMSEQSDMSFLPRIFLDPYYYANFLKMIGRNIGFLPAMVLIWQTFRSKSIEVRRFLQFYLFGYVCYALIFHYHATTHDYYSIMLIPVAGLALGTWWFERVAPSWKAGELGSLRNLRLVGLAILVGLFCSAMVATKGFQSKPASLKSGLEAIALNAGVSQKLHTWLLQKKERNQELVRQLEEIGEAVDHDANVLHLTDDHGKSLIFHGQLEGHFWPTRERFELLTYRGSGYEDEIAYFESLRDEGKADYFVITKMDELEKSADLITYVGERYPLLLKKEYVRIYDLRSPGK